MANEPTSQGTPSVDAKSAAGVLDSTALNDIATNGALLNQTISELIQSLGSLANIVLPVPNGGTGLSSVGIGDLLYGSAANTYSLLADIATGNALISGGVGVAPSWGKIGLTTHVSGTLPIANGGTNKTSFTAYAIICGGTTTTGALQSVASLGTAGQPLLSGGAGALPAFGTITGTEAIGSMILVPANQDYKIAVNMPFAGTIVTMTTISTGGTCTLVTKINATAVTGLSNAVSTSEVTTTATALNTFAAGDDIVLTVSANAACVNLSFMIKATRVLA